MITTDDRHAHCPLCGSCIPLAPQQQPGDMCLCSQCGTLATFTADLDLRLATGDEVDNLLADPDQAAAVHRDRSHAAWGL